MIDPVAYKEMVPNTKIVPTIQKTLVRSDLDEMEKILVNPLAYGFNFGDKTWGKSADTPTTHHSTCVCYDKITILTSCLFLLSRSLRHLKTHRCDLGGEYRRLSGLGQ